MFPLQPDVCKNNPNCHYKLYKRKEQECEKLKEETEGRKEFVDKISNLLLKMEKYTTIYRKV